MRQLGTFNTIGQFRSEFGGNFPVWSRVRELYQGGGMIDVAGMGLNPGDIIHAGTMVKFNGPGKQVEVITAGGSDRCKSGSNADYHQQGYRQRRFILCIGEQKLLNRSNKRFGNNPRTGRYKD